MIVLFLNWIRSQSDFEVYVNEMWVGAEGILKFQAERRIKRHVQGWLGTLVMRARVLLTKKSYKVVVTDNLQKQIEQEFQDTMLLMNTKVHKKVGLDDEAEGKSRIKEQINMDKYI